MVDAHVHFWAYDPAAYPWMDPATQALLQRDFTPADWLAAAAGTRFTSLVAVQARQVEAETDYLLALADAHPFIRGVVGWVDLRAPPAALGASLARLAAHPRLVGVRHVVHDEPDDTFMLRPDFQRGIAALAAHGLAFDLLIFEQHLAAAALLARAFPAQTFVLDHAANPRVGEALQPWRGNLAALAACPNVSVKLSGLATRAPAGAPPEAFAPVLDAVLELFGPARCMIGSDWPVALCGAASYAHAAGAVEAWLKGKDAAVVEAIAAGNAERISRLKP
jgi:L-fuconolactonase